MARKPATNKEIAMAFMFHGYESFYVDPEVIQDVAGKSLPPKKLLEITDMIFKEIEKNHAKYMDFLTQHDITLELED